MTHRLNPVIVNRRRIFLGFPIIKATIIREGQVGRAQFQVKSVISIIYGKYLENLSNAILFNIFTPLFSVVIVPTFW